MILYLELDLRLDRDLERDFDLSAKKNEYRKGKINFEGNLPLNEIRLYIDNDD